MDRNSDGVVEYETDLLEVAKLIAQRKFPEATPDYQELFDLLARTYNWENTRRDLDHDGKVTPNEFIQGHEQLAKQMAAHPSEGIAFIAKAAGGFFDILDLDGDGYLSLADVQDYADAYCKGGDWVAANFTQLLDSAAAGDASTLGMSKALFLELVRQFWFESDQTLPGSHLFGQPAETSW
ncbi:EF-hand domain-containing protein [Neosynechococcus sphagnicola]|nr:EF-hand domain-containing protein [Neosynechococcus sphagnicola]